MDILDGLGKFAKSVADKTGNMVDKSRLKSKINAMKGEIYQFKSQIGEHYWSTFEAGEPCPQQLEEIRNEIKYRIDAIAGLEAEIAALRVSADQNTEGTAAFCQSCGAKLAPGAQFCSSCGAKM